MCCLKQEVAVATGRDLFSVFPSEMLSPSPWTAMSPFFPASMTVERYHQGRTDRTGNAKRPATPGGPFMEHRGGGASGYTGVLFAGDISVNRWQSLSSSHTALSRNAEELSWLLQLCRALSFSVRSAGVRERRIDPPGTRAEGSASLGSLSHLWCSKPFPSALKESKLDCRGQGQQ